MSIPHGSGDSARCPDADVVAAFIEGRLAAGDHLATLLHLVACARCRQAVELARAILDAARPHSDPDK